MKAANQHHPIAALEAGYWCRAQTDEVEPNSEAATRLLDEMLNWYKVAARSGLPMAELAIAYCHETGLAVEQNKALAYSMYHDWRIEMTGPSSRGYRTNKPWITLGVEWRC